MVDVILPALDEAQSLPGVLARFPQGFAPLIVDNGSSDRTAEVGRSLGAVVVSEARRGFGSACYAGLMASRTELICFMDCDGSLDPRELPMVAAPVKDGILELCLGARTAVGRDAWPWHARAANRVLAAELRRRARVSVSDLGPMRCMRREQLIELALSDRGFGWPLEMVLRAAAAGWRIGEVPVTYRARSGGKSKVSGSVTGSFRAVRDMGALLR